MDNEELTNVPELNTTQYRERLKSLVRARVNAVKAGELHINLPLFVWGKPGVAKSFITDSTAKEESWGFFENRLSQCDPTDLRGFPYINPKDGKADFIRFESVLPDPDDLHPMILFLDEFPQAPELIQSAAYQLINDRKLGAYTLPINCVIVAAGNFVSDGGVHFEMSGALKNRFSQIRLAIDYDGFITYMSKQGYDETLFSYLYINKNSDREKLYDYAPEKYLFPTFRSWEKAAQLVKYGMDYQSAIACTVGNYLAIDFMFFKDMIKDIPDAATIVKNKVYYKEIEKQLVASQKVGNCLMKKELAAKLNNDEKFLYFRYFADMHNPDNVEDKREELTVLFLTNIKDNLDLLDPIDIGWNKAVNSGSFVIDKSLKLGKDPSVYHYIFARWNVLNEM